jgi:hypothetical protein
MLRQNKRSRRKHYRRDHLFGHIAVTQALLPTLPYPGTKFAFEAVSDSFRRERAPCAPKCPAGRSPPPTNQGRL